MSFCANCGTQAMDDDALCSACGQWLGGADALSIATDHGSETASQDSASVTAAISQPRVRHGGVPDLTNEEVLKEVRQKAGFHTSVNVVPVTVDLVFPRSPSDYAGLARGDVIVKVGLTPVENMGEFLGAIRSLDLEQRFTLEVRREQKLVTLDVVQRTPLVAERTFDPIERPKETEMLALPELVDVVDGTGWAPPVGSKVSITIDEEKLTLRDFQSVEYVLPLTALRSIDVHGSSSTKNFGLGGFGFDLKTAAKSIAFAKIVNRLTTKVKSWVLVSIESNLGRVTLLFPNAGEIPVRHLFRPAQDRALEFSNKPQGVQDDDLVSGLERISALHEKGVLSDEEFKKMKEKLLG